MKIFCSRSLVSTVLSCWFGFLACLLGCAQPALAAALCKQAQDSGENLGSGNATTEDSPSCCEPGRHSSREPNESKHRGASCCSLDAPLIQKQNAVSPLSSGTPTALLVSFTFHPLGLGSTSGAVRPPKVGYAGRDLLLQVHVLRI
jgi:hypothetical protein